MQAANRKVTHPKWMLDIILQEKRCDKNDHSDNQRLVVRCPDIPQTNFDKLTDADKSSKHLADKLGK